MTTDLDNLIEDERELAVLRQAVEVIGEFADEHLGMSDLQDAHRSLLECVCEMESDLTIRRERLQKTLDMGDWAGRIIKEAGE